MTNTSKHGATNRRARLAVLAAFMLVVLAGCTGGTGGSGLPANYAPTTGGGGGTANSAPVITSTAPTTATVGVLYSYQAAATDADGDTLSWSLSVKPTGMTVSAAGLVSWTPTAGQEGSHSVTLQVSDGTATAQQSWTINVAAASGGGGSLPASVTLTDMGALPNGMKVLSDMVEFDGKLFIAASINPLGSPFGAGVYTFNGSTIGTAFYDSGSQGFLRCKVYNNKLYIPDGDPNGYAPGKVYIWSPGSATPLATNVTDAVHNFDVVEYNGSLYVSGSNLSGQSTLHKFNTATSTWDQASAGSHTRLKYMGVLDNEIWSSKTAASNSADFVKIGTAMTQSGFVFSTGGGNLISAVEMIDGKLYMSVWGSSIGVNNIIVSTGGTTSAISGITGLMWDVIKHTDGNYYAVAWDGTNDLIFGSTDGTTFTQLYGQAGTKFEQQAGNQDGRPSIASYSGKLYVGGSTNGHLYRLD